MASPKQRPTGTKATNVPEDEIGAEPVFPPTDPVVRVGRDRSTKIVGGFSGTSMSSVDVERSAENARPGDEAIAYAVRRELREDAATAELRISVDVDGGVVRLRGRVPELTDAENAEEVAGRVPGVGEVVEELVVTAQEE